MIQQIFAVKDLKVEEMNTPFFVTTAGQAIRSFSDLAMDANTIIHSHPEDFELWRIGAIDLSTGCIIDNDASRVCFATDFIKRE